MRTNGAQLTLAAALLSLGAACGPAVDSPKLGGGKDGVTRAAFFAVKAAVPPDSLQSPSALRPSSFSVRCPVGGEVTLALQQDAGPGDARFLARYVDCSVDAGTRFNGEGLLGLSLVPSQSDLEAIIYFDGALELEGALNDSLVIHWALTGSATALRSQGGPVSVSVKGSVSTLTGEYSLSEEQFTFTAEPLTSAPDELQRSSRI